MPFKSKAQQKWMFATHPKMAKRWAKETPSIKKLPARIAKTSTYKPSLVKATAKKYYGG